jgi:hypothetical protein
MQAAERSTNGMRTIDLNYLGHPAVENCVVPVSTKGFEEEASIVSKHVRLYHHDARKLGLDDIHV